MGIYLGNKRIGHTSNLGVKSEQDDPSTSIKQWYVRFYRPDGELLYSFTTDEVRSSSWEIPTQPDWTITWTCGSSGSEHDDNIVMSKQGWNFTKQQIIDFVSNNDSDLNVGGMYQPADGKNHIKLVIAENAALEQPLCYKQSKASSVVVDWGDGSTTFTDTSTSYITRKHKYPGNGTYHITMQATNSATLSFGSSSSYTIIGNNSQSATNPSRVYSTRIRQVLLSGSVVIGTYSFSYCYSLSSINIPNSVTSIGNYAFYDCYHLSSINIPSSVTSIGSQAFQYCYSLSSINIPSSITSISSNAFYGCYHLSSINIPSSVTSIGSDVFQNCYSLQHIFVDKTNTKYDSRNDCNCIIETSTNKVIAVGRNYTIPDGCTSDITSNTFTSSITHADVPSYVKSISDYAFAYCYSLSSVTIPNSVTSIGTYAFYNCQSLSSINIPSSVTSISGAFYYCYSLSSISIPNSVTSIGNYAFYNCHSLSSINIPNSVTSIGTYAFQYCYSLSSVTIPNSVTSIGSQAFYQCYGLHVVDFRNRTSVPTLANANVFSNVNSNCKIVVPDSLYDSWITANVWSTDSVKQYIIKASEYQIV